MFLRKSFRDPKEGFSWFVCSTAIEEAVDCTSPDLSFSYFAETKRFVFSEVGGWHKGETDQPGVMAFGTCTPYYD